MTPALSPNITLPLPSPSHFAINLRIPEQNIKLGGNMAIFRYSAWEHQMESQFNQARHQVPNETEQKPLLKLIVAR